MSKYVVAAGASGALAVLGVVVVVWSTRRRLPWPHVGPRGEVPAHLVRRLMSPVTVAAAAATEVVARLADRRIDRWNLRGETEAVRRDTFYLVVAAGLVGLADDLLAGERRWDHVGRRGLRAAGWAAAFAVVSAQVLDLGARAVVVGALLAAVSADAGAEIERRTPGAGVAAFVVAAAVAALASSRSAQLVGLALALGAATVVGLAARWRLGAAGAGTTGVAGAALAGGVLLANGTDGALAALGAALVVAAGVEVARRRWPAWAPVPQSGPPPR